MGTNTKKHTGLSNVPKRILFLHPGTYMLLKQKKWGTS